MAHAHHGHPAACGVAVLTISDTRSRADDLSGDTACRLIEAAGHAVVDRAIVADEPDDVRAAVRRWLERTECHAVITSGGTGIAPRDRTYEALDALLECRLDGFGELYRMLSWEQVGSAAMASRAVGGVARGKLIFALPGAPQAVELALVRLILPELGHLVAELRRGVS